MFPLTFRAARCFTACRSVVNSPFAHRKRPQSLALHSSQFRLLSSSFDESKASGSHLPLESEKPAYEGPLAQTFRRLKIFSLSSLSLSCTLAPFMFIVESNLPMTARVALTSIAIGTSGISTGLVGWCGQPYVTRLRYLQPEENDGVEGIRLITQNLLLKPRITTVGRYYISHKVRFFTFSLQGV